jgi:Uma2 family endonuclease
MALRELQPKPMTVKEFEAFLKRPENHEHHFELIDGFIVEKFMPTEEHGEINSLLDYFVVGYFRKNPIGKVYSNASYKVRGDKKNWRQPDVAIVLNQNRPVTKKGAAVGLPDIIFEIKSPDDSIRLLQSKAEFYLANGTKLVALIYTDKRIMEVRRPDSDPDFLTADNTFTCEGLLPGFSLPLSELFSTSH